MLPDVWCASCLNHDDWFLSAGTVFVDFPCHLLPSHAEFSEDDHIGVGSSNFFDSLLNTAGIIALSGNEGVVENKHDISR